MWEAKQAGHVEYALFEFKPSALRGWPKGQAQRPYFSSTVEAPATSPSVLRHD